MNVTNREKLVLIGNGMAGINTIEQMLKLAPDKYEITVIGKEPYPNYNRIQLSYLLEGSKTFKDTILNDYPWYEQNGIQLLTGVEATRIDLSTKRVQMSDGQFRPYDKLIIATGSNPAMLPIPGVDKDGIVSFRDMQDCQRMTDAACTFMRAAVIGGGLLGLEAAKGLLKLGMQVTVVHLCPDLMERQLDSAASAMLKAELEEQGIQFLLNKKTVEILGDNRVKSLQFEDGSKLETDFVVMAVGIVPLTTLARDCGLEVGRGIIVDDYMQTSAPDVYAVGECNQHRGISYGLIAPLFEQGAVLAKHLCGLSAQPYQGSIVSTKLKISGVDVFSAGEFQDEPGLDVIRMQDNWKKTYKKVLLRENRIVGGVLFGDVSDSAQLFKWVKAQETMTREIHEQLVGTSHMEGADPLAFVTAMPSDEIVCGCNGVTKGMIMHAITEQGLSTVDEIKTCTGASRSCGGCKPMVEQILAMTLGDRYEGSHTVVESLCGCTTHNREDVISAIRDNRLTHVREVMHVLDWHNLEGCTKCRPAINYYIGMVWPEAFEDEKDSRFVNERLHANIQKDGTYTVVPRMYGGVTTPEQLRKIADVADKYDVKMVKVTGGQRLILLGVKKADLPHIWEELGMPSGYAYAKALRTVKTCVGSTFCRFGTQDSIGMGIVLEKKFERLWMPAKFKMAVNGCPRNCAEAEIKDFGIIGNEGGWEIYVGGNGGVKLRAADLLCKVKTDEELIELAGAFIQFYRETGKYGERTSDWIERLGLPAIAQEIVENKERRKELVARIELALQGLHDPWREVVENEGLRHQLYENIHVK
ncbi:NAD(P)/FAD-dependent oxidoreductase [Paenibacillus sp. SYP-B3998]|uniref:NAD(P)/FAD-dependent oxidoreductase n=1 Tax=Paenibacillus sp. SYP-B3998 TaxID=2678564 RepID=A0A6G3ZUN2_9BACL|nr:nitrite reductase large subunit NirB [Paenibacillus sp. SYP-B3998]NEW05825.1 NAD(P)/FAD-dependent oxidoreductase [Paenibacillus sp. SYP-B3998]